MLFCFIFEKSCNNYFIYNCQISINAIHTRLNSWTRKHSAQGYRELPSKAWVVIAKEEKNQTGADSIEKEILNMVSIMLLAIYVNT